ncbi:MAG: 50S ribosomal protein L22 [Pseudomonadaceae bacterium]|nr:50S ribosomal protein L22 [Pseudomonadaceae bacterium]
MSQQANPRRIASNEAMSSAKGVKGSPQKAQLVLELIRGKPVEQALDTLQFCRRRLAEPTRKVLLSAIANAANNHQLNVDKLVVAHAYADKGMVMRRFHARGRGRSAPILKPRCHITIVVAEREAKEAKKAAPKKATKSAPKKAEPKTEQQEA